MNYLAHLVLSPADAESMVGNLMGDFRKYLGDEVLPPKVHEGIGNHVRVDRFTDNDALLHKMKGHFSPRRRRYAGVIIDLVFDYFLIHNWDRYVAIDLHEFIERAHAGISSKWTLMPARMKFVMEHMIRDEWLRSYADLEGIARALNGISARMRFANQLAGAIEEVELNFAGLEESFVSFFPRLIDHVQAANAADAVQLQVNPGMVNPCSTRVWRRS